MGLFNRSKPKSVGICAVGLNDHGLAICYALEGAKDKLHVLYADFYPDVSDQNLSDPITEFVQKHNLTGVTCSWVLSPDAYQLIPLEEPKVPEAEMALAARWQVKDLIDFPIENAAIDVFRIPPHGHGGQKKVVNVVVANLDYLMRGVDAINKSGLQVSVIDINETALRNIAALYPEDEKGVAVVSLSPEGSEVLMTAHKLLYFSRKLNVEYEALVPLMMKENEGAVIQNDWIDSLVLEITRSYDYYTSQLAQDRPCSLILPPIICEKSDVLAKLKEMVTPETMIIDFNELCHCQLDMDDVLQTHCMAVIGSALRIRSEEDEAAAS